MDIVQPHWGIRLKSSMRKCKIDTAQPRYFEVKMTKDFTS